MYRIVVYIVVKLILSHKIGDQSRINNLFAN